jgi:hypothetical protein
MLQQNDCSNVHVLVFEAINSLRDQWLHANGRGRIRLDLIARLKPLQSDPVVNAFVADLKSSGLLNDIYCVETQRAVCRFQNGLILGSFSVPYNLAMSLECILYSKVKKPHFVMREIDGRAVGITITRATAGFGNHRSVALFMEDFEGGDPNGLVACKRLCPDPRISVKVLEKS